jgi:prevent-host-death family protein
MTTVSKSQFKAKALEFFREVERTGQPIIITDRGNPVLKLCAYATELREATNVLRGSVMRYDDPTLPIGADDWERER